MTTLSRGSEQGSGGRHARPTEEGEAPALLTSREVAALLGVTPSTVTRYVRQGYLSAVRVTPRSNFRVRAEDVRRHLDVV